MVPRPLGTRLPSSSGLLCTADRVGKYELRTAGACCPALSVVLGLCCEREVSGTIANQVQVLYNSVAQCGSTTCFCGADLRAWFGVFGFSFASFYSGGALLDSRVRNHARVQDRSSFGISLFKRKFSYFRLGISLLFRKNLSHLFLSDRILYYSRLSVCLHVCELLPICPVYWAAHLSPSI